MRDRAADGHTRRVTDMTLVLARRVGMAPESLSHVRRGALLHDIGNIVVPDAVLFKPGPLTEDERAVMRRHTDYAYDLLGAIEFLRPALEIPCFHHERWDGSGYPRGLAGEAIPLAARVFAVADAYHAMTSERPYAPAESHESAIRAIAELSGRHFDPRVVKALLAMSAQAVRWE
jgi:HD-GYP domain-containing protein (c-di-GMP phosphodiesterase class II)